MCVIVNLDLVVTAVINSEMRFIEGLGRSSLDNCFQELTISPNKVMSYAKQMKHSDLGRVVINFRNDDVVDYFEMNPYIFRKIGHSSVYRVSPKDMDCKRSMSDVIGELLLSMIAKLNYTDRVLSTVGLLQ